MSGQIEVHGVVNKWHNIKVFLFGPDEEFLSQSHSTYPATPASTTSSSGNGNKDREEKEEWGTDWGWTDESAVEKSESKTTFPKNEISHDKFNPRHGTVKEDERECDRKNGESWIQKCVIANSPMADVLVIARDRKAVILTSEWDVKNSRMKYSKAYEGTVTQEDGEIVTSAICIPLISKKKSSPGAPDWTCVVLGFNNGYVRMYTESGSLLVNQMFHNQPVSSVKCRSYHPSTNSSEHDQLEELIVLYQTVIVTMDGFGLFQTLRACRNHLARLQANAAEMIIDPPPLSYKKWQFENEQSVTDCESIGLNTPSTFDHMFNASLLGGFHARCKAVPFTSNIFMSSGDKPYLAFHYAQEGQAIPVFTEIAYAMASKLKSSLMSAATGWLGFGAPKVSTNTPREKPQIEPATSMSRRYALPDIRRLGKSIAISPCRKLSAVTDTLGRVILIDNDRGIAVRMWKGYRDAQCSWLQVEEEVSSRSRVAGRKALFLVIYAPRRGHLEVFSMQQGPKVATFAVSKTGRLLGTPFGMMGLNNIPIRGGNRPIVQVLFIDHEAQLQALNIPFHLALCDKTSSKVKDMHLLKSLQRLVREDQYSHSDLMEILNDIKTQPMVNQAFRLLTQKCKKLDVLTSIVQGYLQNFCDEDDRDLSVVFVIQSLIELYSTLISSAEKPPSYSTAIEGAGSSSHDRTILKCLRATEKEMKLLQDMAQKDSFNKKPSQKSVSFQQDEEFLNLNEFFATFSIEFDPSKLKSSTPGDSRVRLNQKNDNSSRLGTLLLCGCLNSRTDLTEWKNHVKNAGLIPKELMQLALKFWCENALLSSSYVNIMEQLYHVLRALCELEGVKPVTSEFNQVSQWWEDMRKEIAKSSQIFHIYSFAMVCRAVAIDLQHQAETDNQEKGKKGPQPDTLNNSDGTEDSIENLGSSGDEADWVDVSLDMLKWNILLKQIEDLSLLSIILVQRPKLEIPTLPILTAEIDDLSVLNLLDKGKGCIAELVGKWLTAIGLDPGLITDDLESSEVEAAKVIESSLTKADEQQSVGLEDAIEAFDADKGTSYVLELIKCLQENFSVSLSPSIILANYCWEYCLEWNKESDCVEYLSAAVKCVNAIPSAFIRQGMMSMMWSTFIVKKFANVVSKSKASRDKLIDKVSGFTSLEKKEAFLKICVGFLDQFMETNVLCEGFIPPRNAALKRNHWFSDAASASLTDLALIQPHSNYEMILLHYQLALVTHGIHAFHIRKVTMKPSNLFDTKARMMFFTAMSSQAPYSNVEVDLALKILREEFLGLIISNAIHHIPEELSVSCEGTDNDNVEFKNITPSLEGVKECENWIQKCFELGRIWGLDLDGLRINQVCEYYSSGFDRLGMEAISSVSGRDILGSKLLVISGMRINYIIQRKTESITEIVSSLSTNLSNWLDSLNYSKLRCLRFSKNSITQLTEQVIQLIPDSSYDYKLAEEILLSSGFLQL